MVTKVVKSKMKASRVVASTFGFLAGLGGMWHSIGEVLQGNIATGSIYIYSWAQGPIATNMGGEPGMTIIPNFLVTGIIGIVISLAVIVWSVAFVQRRWGGCILIGLSVVMMLVGGGFGPPIIGILAGAAGTKINKPLTWWYSHLSDGIRKFAARLWPWFFGISAASGILLVIGSIFLVYFFNVNNADFFTNIFFFTVLSLIVTVVMGFTYDTQPG